MITVIADNKYVNSQNLEEIKTQSFEQVIETTVKTLKEETSPYATVVVLDDNGESITLLKTPEGLKQFTNKDGKLL